jgi:hypothetical protein
MRSAEEYYRSKSKDYATQAQQAFTAAKRAELTEISDGFKRLAERAKHSADRQVTGHLASPSHRSAGTLRRTVLGR